MYFRVPPREAPIKSTTVVQLSQGDHQPMILWSQRAGTCRPKPNPPHEGKHGAKNPLTTMQASRCGRREKTQSKTVTKGMQRSGRTCTVYCRVLGCLSVDRYWHQTKLNSIG